MLHGQDEHGGPLAVRLLHVHRLPDNGVGPNVLDRDVLPRVRLRVEHHGPAQATTQVSEVSVVVAGLVLHGFAFREVIGVDHRYNTTQIPRLVQSANPSEGFDISEGFICLRGPDKHPFT